MKEQLKAMNEYVARNHCWMKNALPTLIAEHSFKEGAKWQLGNLWHDAQGDDLPPIDEEVIVLLDNGKVCFGHRPDPNRSYIGKSVINGNKMKYKVMTYGKGGWNIPDVKLWLDVSIPNLEEEK